jgi:DnaK suppressor protein
MSAKKQEAASTTPFKNFEPYKLKKGEDYMSDRQKDHFRHILRQWKAELMEEVDRTVSHMKDEAADIPCDRSGRGGLGHGKS